MSSQLNIIERNGKRWLICKDGWEHCHLACGEGETWDSPRIQALMSMMEPGHYAKPADEEGGR